MRNNLAPIVLFVYNRPWHTEQTLNTLMQNELADKSTLFIFADGPKENVADDVLGKIRETREIIKSKQWCKEVIISEKGKNKGLAHSIIAGVTEVVNKHGKIIVLEDDIVTSPVFLKYMNETLNFYESEAKVSTISAYIEPIKFNGKASIFLTKGSSWGWGTWKRTWDTAEWSAAKLLQTIKIREKIEAFNYSGYPFFQMLQDQVDGKIDSWAIRFYASCFLNQGLHLTTPQSLVRNIGFDGSGTHCTIDKKFMDSLILSKVPLTKSIPLIPNQKIPILVKNFREGKVDFFHEIKYLLKKTLK